jgi:catechol 2,3-dioxygenase-like lactoylglutathione lyase family enzyme
MLHDSPISAVVAVKDLKAAKDFYEGKLGLKPGKEDPSGGGIAYPCASGSLFVYESGFAGTNKATAAAWDVKDVDKVVEELKGKGISFEHYDMPGVKMDGDVHVMGPLRAAWFTDPDGNILNIVSGM